MSSEDITGVEEEEKAELILSGSGFRTVER